MLRKTNAARRLRGERSNAKGKGMPEIHQQDWNPFRVGEPPNPAHNPSPDRCARLTHVWHVTHQSNAVNIVRHDSLKADLVFDDCRLNTERIRVVWLSPNDWTGAGGSRYGTVGFRVRWETLISGRHAYWVGAMEKYNPWALRILLTRRDYSSLGLKLYDATVGDGPWWHDTENFSHYWNPRYCLEFMLEDDLPLIDSDMTSGILHHAQRCNIQPNGACAFADTPKDKGIALFVAAVIANDLPAKRLHLAKDLGTSTDEAEALWDRFRRIVQKKAEPFGGYVTHNDAVSKPLVRAILGAYSRGDKLEVNEITSLFASGREFRLACADLVESSLGLAPGALEMS